MWNWSYASVTHGVPHSLLPASLVPVLENLSAAVRGHISAECVRIFFPGCLRNLADAHVKEP